jgi:integrase
MGRRKGDRVAGPYFDKTRKRWRLIVIGADGERTYQPVSSEAEGLAEKERAERDLIRTAGRTIADALAEYAEYIKAKGNKADHIDDTMWKSGRIFPNHDLPLASLRSKADAKRLYQELQAYVSPQTGKPYAPDSHRNMLIQARTFLRWCKDEQGWIDVNVFEGIKGMGRRHRGKKQLTTDEAARWFEVALRWASQKREGAVAALVALNLGLRSSEICKRVVRELDEDGRILRVTDSKTEASNRAVEVDELLRPYLLQLCHGKTAHEYIFGKGTKLRNRAWPRKWVKKICRAAGVPEVGAHSMRGLHTSITVEAGRTSHIVAKALREASSNIGHGKTSITASTYVGPGVLEGATRKSAIEILRERIGPKRAVAEAPHAALKKIP